MGKKNPISFYMSGVAAMAAITSIFTFLRAYLTIISGLRASSSLHRQALGKVLR